MSDAPSDRPVLHVPARDIPVPPYMSPQAQALLATRMESIEYPPLDDPDAWRSMVRAADERILALTAANAPPPNATVTEAAAGGARVYVVTPTEVPSDDPRVYLDLHGGGLFMGGGERCRALGITDAVRVGARVWAVDYRMPPDHPYPAALDDCLAAYRALLRDHRPADVIVGGNSAGGNLAAALVLRARDEGLPLPAAVVLLVSELDLTESGDSFRTNLGVDTVLTSLMPANLLYADGHDLAHPYLSPLFGDFTTGFPPTFLSSSTRDLFLSNAVRMHRALRAAGIVAELHVLDAAPHAGFFGAAPEDAEIVREMRRFVDRHWPSAPGASRRERDTGGSV